MNVKILLITNYDAFEKRMDKNHFFLMKRLECDERFTVVNEDNLSNYDINEYDIILNDSWCNHRFDSKICGKMFEDYYQFEIFNRDTEADKYDFIILHYKNDFTMSDKLFNTPLEKKFFVPHHFDLEIWKDWKLPKVYDITMYGSMYSPLYPFRVRVANVLLNSKKFEINHIHHPGYNNMETSITNDNLSKIINQSWLTLSVPTDNVKYDDFLKKYGEATLSCSLVLGYIPKEAEYCYKDDFCKIVPEMTDDEIIQQVTIALSNKDKLTTQIEDVYNRFKEEFDMNVYPEKIYNSCIEAYKSSSK